jgi:hypothetical protein
MAIYHLSVKPVQRSKGRSSTAAAAYRSGSEIEDKRTGLKHNYTKKKDVEHTEIITPDGVDIPNRSDLWNMAEAAEKRKDSCTAREYEVNLPYELTEKQQTELAREFCKKLANDHGIAVDLCIHRPTEKEIDAGKDAKNHHAHILTTTRKITNNGLTDKADIEKSGRARKEDLRIVRELWADIANKHLKEAGLSERIDSRSLKDQGSNLEPTIKMGKTATEMERQGIRTFKGNINRKIKLENEVYSERESRANREIAKSEQLIAVSQHHTEFGERAIAETNEKLGEVSPIIDARKQSFERITAAIDSSQRVIEKSVSHVQHSVGKIEQANRTVGERFGDSKEASQRVSRRRQSLEGDTAAIDSSQRVIAESAELVQRVNREIEEIITPKVVYNAPEPEPEPKPRNDDYDYDYGM